MEQNLMSIIATIISIIGIIISIISAVFAFTQTNVAKQTYKLQKNIYEESLENISLDICNSFFIKNKKNKKIIYFLQFTIINNSDKNNSIKEINLKLEYENKSLLKLKGKKINNNKYLSFDLPLYMEAHSSIKEWMMFEIDENIFNSIEVKTHFIELKDLKNNIYIKEEIFIKKGELNE